MVSGVRDGVNSRFVPCVCVFLVPAELLVQLRGELKAGVIIRGNVLLGWVARLHGVICFCSRLKRKSRVLVDEKQCGYCFYR